MKRKPAYIKAILLSASFLAFPLAIFFSPGSAKSTCTAGFAMCTSTCTEARFFASASADGNRFFPQCACAGLISERVQSVGADAGQQERLEALISEVSEMSVFGHTSLASRLQSIGMALENLDYEAYERSVNLLQSDIERLNDADKQQLIDLMKHYAEK